MDKINILCAADDNYVPLAGIMLTSLYESNTQSELVTYILADGISNRGRIKFAELAKRYQTRIEIISVNDNYIAKCPVKCGEHITKAAYLRIFAAKYLPKEVNRILYLDCDILVNQSIDEFWHFDLADKILGAVEENVHIEASVRLFQDETIPYYNSGVLLINVELWRKLSITEKCLRYIEENSHNKNMFVCHDQDVLNVVLQDFIQPLPMKYNFQMTCLLKEVIESYKDRNLYKTALTTIKENPIIIHYCTYQKPWDWHLPSYPYRKLREHIRRCSLWRFYLMPFPLKERIKRRILAICWSLQIKKSPNPYIDCIDKILEK